MGSSAQISSGVCRCGSQEQVPEEGSGRFRKIPEGSGRFRKVPESCGVRWCRFRRRVPEGSGGYAGVGSGGRFRKVPKGWFRVFGGFRRVPARVGVGSGGRVQVWFVALQPGQEQPCDCFDHADNIVHMGKTIAQKGAHVVKDGIGIRMSMLLLLGISPKLIFPQQRKLMGSSAQISTGVCRCGLQEQVPEEGSGRFRRVPACAGVGSGAGFRKVPDGAGVCWRRFRR